MHLQTHSKDYCKQGKEREGTDSDGDKDKMKEGPCSENRTLNNLCWICGECFNSAKNLRVHLQAQHKDSYENWRESAGADSEEDERKTKFHPTDFLCWVCGTFLSSAETLTVHLQTHNEESG